MIMDSIKKERYSNEDLEYFRGLIEQKITEAKRQHELIMKSFTNDASNGTEDTAPQFKAFDEGSAVMNKETNAQLAIRQEKFIRDLQNALIRIRKQTYGICRENG
jgi:hypothetical protein